MPGKRSLWLIVVPLLLAACGTRGGLDLPPGPGPDPLLGKPAAKTPAKAPTNLSTPASPSKDSQ